MEFAGRVALVTGAGSGIGRATAWRLARDGAAIGLLGHTRRAGVGGRREPRSPGAAVGGDYTAYWSNRQVPEPTTLVLFGVGLIGLAAMRLRRA